MTVSNRPVTSREYKLMLNADRFADRAQGIDNFWRLVCFLLAKQGVDLDKQVEEQTDVKERHTWYVDTPSLGLRQRGFVLRQRREEGEDENKPFKTTLKYRASDRYVSAAQDCHGTQKGKFKFEEDILPPFVNKFSHSFAFRKKKLPDLETLADAIALFPGLDALGLPAGTPLRQVNAFEAFEYVRWLGKISFAPEAEVKCCLNFWYLMDVQGELPLVAEFSFDYDLPDKDTLAADALERFPTVVVDQTNRFFRGLQRHRNWIDFRGTTKTAFAYESL